MSLTARSTSQRAASVRRCQTFRPLSGPRPPGRQKEYTRNLRTERRERKRCIYISHRARPSTIHQIERGTHTAGRSTRLPPRITYCVHLYVYIIQKQRAGKSCPWAIYTTQKETTAALCIGLPRHIMYDCIAVYIANKLIIRSPIHYYTIGSERYDFEKIAI